MALEFGKDSKLVKTGVGIWVFVFGVALVRVTSFGNAEQPRKASFSH